MVIAVKICISPPICYFCPCETLIFAFSLIFITVYPLCGENICGQNSFENIDDNSQIEVKRVSKITITKEDGITVATYLYDNDGCPIKIISEISYQKYTQEIIYGAGDMIDGKEGMYEIVKISESDPVKVGTVTYTTTTEIEYLQ